MALLQSRFGLGRLTPNKLFYLPEGPQFFDARQAFLNAILIRFAAVREIRIFASILFNPR
jgi:hypothetical protein